MCEPEPDNLAEKIILKINEAFENDDIQEMEILPVPVKVLNTTPILVEQQVLGIESWCLEYVSKYSYRRVMYWRKKKASTRRYESLKNYLNLVLFANPEIASFWNIKRELIEKGYKFVENDFYLTKVLLSLYPKSAQILAYRRWLFKFVNISEELISEEFHICSLIAERKTNNYHAWAHRWWLLQSICMQEQFANFIRIEMVFMIVWVKKNVSQFSGLHYLLNLVKQMCELPLLLCGVLNFLQTFWISRFSVENGNDDALFWDKLELIMKTLMLNYNLIMYHPDHESLWVHRQSLITFAIHFVYDHMSQKPPSSSPSELLPPQPLPVPMQSQKLPITCSPTDTIEQMYKKVSFFTALRDHIEQDADLVHILDNLFVRRHVKWLIHYVKIFYDE